MSAEPDLHKEFIQRRAEGQTCAAIAQALKLSRHTCVNWNKRFKTEIQALRAVRIDALQTEFFVRTEQRLETIGRRARVLQAELSRRSLADISTEKLFGLVLKFNTALRQEERDPFAALNALTDTELAAALENLPEEDFEAGPVKNEQNVNQT